MTAMAVASESVIACLPVVYQRLALPALLGSTRRPENEVEGLAKPVGCAGDFGALDHDGEPAVVVGRWHATSLTGLFPQERRQYRQNGRITEAVAQWGHV